MSSEHQIKTALDYQLNQFSTAESIDIAWTGFEYSPTVGTSYIKEDFLPAVSAQSGIGTDSRNRFVGVYQLTVNTNINRGLKLFNDIYDSLKPYFKRGTVIEYDSIQVRITKMYEGSYLNDDPWFTKVINIEFRSDIDN